MPLMDASPVNRFGAANQAADSLFPGFMPWPPGHGWASLFLGLPHAMLRGTARNALSPEEGIQYGALSGNPNWASLWADVLKKQTSNPEDK